MTVSTKPKLKFATLFCLFLFSFSFSSLANSTNPWKEVREKDFAKSLSRLCGEKKERTLIPSQYKVFALNLSHLQETLNAAPLRFAQDAPENIVTIDLPMPDGQFERFQIFNAPIMHPDLAAKYPGIQTYAGVGLDDPSATIRLDVTPNGFHGMILSARHSTVYIDPYSQSDTQHYITYHQKDFGNPGKNFECHVQEKAPINIDFSNAESLQGDCQLRTYNLALACTGEYAQFHGGTVNSVMAAFNTTMNRVNGIYEKDLNILMVLVANNDQLIFLNAGTDPYDNNNAGAMLGQNQTTCDNVIGFNNYDIGHVFSTGGGGLASLNSPCNSWKAQGVTGTNNPVGDPFDVDYVAHELGHQFGANHTFNNSCSNNRNNSTAMEPGSGSTIMAYAGICNPNVQFNSDDYFHAISIQEISNNINGGSGSSCATETNTGNNAPVIVPGNDYTLPISTPFRLVGDASDGDNDPITYCWEQMDNEIATMPPSSSSTNGPAFRSFDPTTEDTRYFPRLTDLVNNVDDDWEELPSVSRTMNFRLTVRDNHQGSGCTEEDDVTLTFSNTSGPFLVQTPNTTMTWMVGESQTVEWDVANTTAAPVSCSDVDILLSIDGGFTYPTILANSVPNTGSFSVTVPNNVSNTCRVMVVCSDNIFFDISNSNFIIEAPSSPTFTMLATPTSHEVCGTAGSVDYTFSLTSLAGFNEAVSFSATGIPANATVAFSPNNIIPTGNTTMTISGLGNVATGSYTIDVTGASNSVTLNEQVNLTVSNGTPTTVSLQTPIHGANEQSLSTVLDWSADVNATSYFVEIATTPAFGGSIVESGTVSTNQYTAQGLSSLTVYYWKVKAVNICGEGTANNWFSFQTGGLGCQVFSSTDVPVTIDANSVNTITSTLNINDNFQISEANVSLEVTHSWVGDLDATLSTPNGASFSLFDQPGVPNSQYGCEEDNLQLTFDSNAASTSSDLENSCNTSGSYALQGTYQPINTLSSLVGENSNGNWSLAITDHVDEDGGSLDGWSLELCFTGTTPNAPTLINNTLSVNAGGSGIADNNHLEASSNSSTPSQITYTVSSLPQNGTLQLNGIALAIGATFTQEDINNNLLTYLNTNSSATTDDFDFDVVTHNGGWASDNTFYITIGGVAPLTAQLGLTSEVSCHNGTDGSVSVDASGGIPPYEYSLNGTDFQTNNVFNNLSSNTYTITVKDAMGETITTNSITLANPAQLVATTNVIGNTVTVTGMGGTGSLTYSMDGVNFQSSHIFENLANGSFNFTVMDENGCTTITQASVNIISAAFVMVEPISCFDMEDGALAVTSVAGGVMPFLYSLDGANFQSSNEFTGLSMGNYTVYVMDATGYIFETGTFSFSNPQELEVSTVVMDNNVSAIGTGGTGDLVYSINGIDFQTSPDFNNLPNDSYTLTVMDENGCTSTTTFLIEFTSIGKLDFDLVFNLYPNPTSGQMTILLDQPTSAQLTIRVFDVAGKFVKEIFFEKTGNQFQQSVDISGLPSGSYELLLTDGEMFGRKRFVKMN